MRRATLLLFIVVMLTTTATAQPPSIPLAGPSDAFRRDALERTAADDRRNFQQIGAKLRTGRDTALAWRQLDSMLAAPTGDMFWTYPATAFYFYCNDLLTPARKAKFRHVWKTWTPYRGDTENHFLMYYATLYLMAGEWPDLPGSEWFNGKSSTENMREAEEYLAHWMDETLRFGLTEWDSPRYFYFYMLPLLTLYDHARDDGIAGGSEKVILHLLADYAAEYLAGCYAGAHSRDGDGSVIDPRNAEARSYAEFYWEDSLAMALPDLAFAAMSRFRCPLVIAEIAHDRDTPFLHREVKRSRAKMRYDTARFTRVEKTTYMTRDYALGSIRGGLQQPIQQHSWDVTFAAARPNNTLFALHPYASGRELGMFFPEEPELMAESILSSKASYGSENKWVGGSPYESITQWGGSLTARYDIPPGTRFGHVDFFLPKSLDMLIKDSDGWIICVMGDVVVGIRVDAADSIAWSEEEKNRRLRLYGGTIGYTVTTGGRELMMSGPVGAALAGRVRADSIRWGGRTSFDSIIYDGPHLQQRSGSDTLTLRSSRRTMTIAPTSPSLRE